MTAVSVEHHDSRTLLRRSIYPDFFGMREYAWLTPSEANQSTQQTATYGGDTPGTADSRTRPQPGDRVELTSKPYLPPTEAQGDAMRPFGSVLEPPMQAL